MTEQEADIYKARLKRVWAPEKEMNRASYERGCLWGAHLRSNVCLFLRTQPALIDLTVFWGHPAVELHCYRKEVFVAVLGLHEKYIEEQHFMPKAKNLLLREFGQRFFSQWRTPFRRGCWLSGYPIEASAHEKAEWMQGFSREELEAWNLKI